MDGDDLHPLGIAFQAQQGVLAGAFAAALGVQPGEQRLQAGPLEALGLQQFGEVQQVGQAAFAIAGGEQALGHRLAVQPGAEGAHEAVLLPQLVVQLGVLALAVPGALVVLAARQLRGVAAQQAGGQGVAQHALAARLGVGGEHRGQFAGLLAVPHALVAAPHAGHATRGELLGDLGGLPVVGDQHGDVAALERLAAGGGLEVGLAARAGGEQRGDPPRAVERRAFAGLLLVEAVVAEPHQVQRGAVERRRQHQRRARLGAGAHRRVVEAVYRERLRAGEQRVERGDQLGRGAVVVGQVVAPRRTVAGLQVGGQVGAAEGVDRLLGVADEAQRGVIQFRRIQAVEDGELDRVGVLEFVDQRQRVLLAQGRRQLGAGRALQRLVEAVEQVVEGQQALRRLARRQLAVELLEQAHLQGDQAPLAGRLGGGQRLDQGVEGFGQLARGGDVALLAGLGQRRRAELGHPVGGLEQRRRVGEVGVQLGAPGRQLGLFVGALAEPAVGLQLGQPGIAVALPERGGVLPARGGGAQFVAARAVLRLDAQVGLAEVAAQALAQRRRGQPLLGQVARPGRVGVGQLVAPGIGEQGVEQLAVVLGQFAVEVAAGLERGVLQGALAEAVDGEDRRLVEAVHGEQQAPPRVFAGMPGVQFGEERIGARRIAARRAVVDRQQRGQPRADAFAQLGGGGGGVGDHEDLPDRELAFEQQARVQRSERPGLAGAGAGLDQAAAVEWRGLQVEAHAGVSAAWGMGDMAIRASRGCPALCPDRPAAGTAQRRSTLCRAAYRQTISIARAAPASAVISAWS
ncbi:hypothetical protein D9M68_333500 [compost metagenome]